MALGVGVVGCSASAGQYGSGAPASSSGSSQSEAKSAEASTVGSSPSNESLSSSSQESSSDSKPSETSSKPEKAPSPSNKIDFLFVIDHSGSMESEQAALAACVPGFVEVLKAKMAGAADLHVGVVAASECPGAIPSEEKQCDKLGALVRETAGNSLATTTASFGAEGPT